MQTKIIKQWPKGLFKILLVSEPIICFPWNLQEAGLDVFFDKLCSDTCVCLLWNLKEGGPAVLSFVTNCASIHVFLCYGIFRKTGWLCCLFWQTVYICDPFQKALLGWQFGQFWRSWQTMEFPLKLGVFRIDKKPEKVEVFFLEIGDDLFNFYRIARQWHLPGW